MSKSVFSCLMVLAAMSAFAAETMLKPGLWEIKVVKQVIDGRDMSAQMAAASAHMQQMQQEMANMPPEQRARMQAMLAQSGAGTSGDGGFRVCISPEMAKRNVPIVDKEGHCQPATVTHSGNQTTYEFSCSSNGSTRTGKGEVTSSGDVITNRIDMTSHTASGATHVMHSESQMHYLGSDCGDVKPVDVPK